MKSRKTDSQKDSFSKNKKKEELSWATFVENLSQGPKRYIIKSRAAAYLETKPRSSFAKNYHPNLFLDSSET